MDFYPNEFSPEARDRIEREKIRAYRELLPNSAYDFNEQNLAIPCIMRLFLAFAKEACALRKERGWTIERIERESNEFRRKLTITVAFDKFPGLDRHWISNWDGSVNSDVERRFRESVVWKEYEELLLTTPALASRRNPASRPIDQRENLRDAILKKKARIVEIERILNRPPLTEHLGRPVHGGQNFRLRLEEERQHLMLAVEELEAGPRKASADRVTDEIEKQAPSMASARAKAAEGKPADRRAMVDAYIEEVLSKTGKKISRTDIWKSVGYKTRTEFEKWQRRDPTKVNKAADERFTKMFTEKPHLKPSPK
jgi:hypothetical protein